MLLQTGRLLVAVSVCASQAALQGSHQTRVPGHRVVLSHPAAAVFSASAPAPASQCAYSLSPASATAPPFGSTANRVVVTTAAGCAWSAVSSAQWLTVVSGASGAGSGTVSYNVGVNPDASQRVGTIAIAGLVLTVTQAATSCSYTLGSTSASVPSTGGPGSFSVVTGTSCTWTAVSSVSWITVTGGATGGGIGAVTYAVAANTTGSQRVGTITLGGSTHTVTQAANSCSYALGSTTASVPATGVTSGAVSVVTGTGCSWNAASTVSWLTVTSGATGSGIGTVNYSAAANPEASPRVGTITIGGTTLTVTQGAATPPAAPPNLRIIR